MVGVRVRAGVRVRVGAAEPLPSQGPVVACEGDGCVRVIELALGVAVGVGVGLGVGVVYECGVSQRQP